MRLATPEDAHLILEMMMDCYIENQKEAPRDVGFDVLKARHWLNVALSAPIVSGYISPGGIIMASVENTFWGDNPFFSALFFYVRPEFRNGLLARSLFRAVEKDARQRKLKYLIFTPQHKPSTMFMTPFMERLGFESYGGIYGKFIN